MKRLIYFVCGLLCISFALLFSGCFQSDGWSRMYKVFWGPASDYFYSSEELALCKAIERGDVVKCQDLIDKNSSIVNSVGKQGVTPLFWAIQIGRFKCFNVLLDNQATATNSTDRAFTVVHISARVHDPKYLKALIDAGVDVDIGNGPRGRTALGEAAVVGNIKAAKMLVQSGASLDSQDEIGDTPLQLAAAQGNFELVHWLLEVGADPTVPNSMNSTLDEMVDAQKYSLSHKSETYQWYLKVRAELVKRGLLKE